MVYGDFPPNTDHFTLAENKRLKAELAAAQGNADDNYKKLMECRAELAAERERAIHQTSIACRAIEELAKLREALERIAAIEDKAFGGDWEEIEEARTIARAVLEETEGKGDA